MRFLSVRISLLLLLSALPVLAGNSVVNLSHYDLMRVDFDGMKREGVVGVIHEATYPRFDQDTYYGPRQTAATRAGLLWGAYHFGDATDPIRQAEHFLSVVQSNWRGPAIQPSGVLLVLDFEKNGHYPGGTMRADQAARFV
jgi:lysozyme